MSQMNKAQARRNSARGANVRSTGHYQVGYGRPPTHTRFKPGQSGNPKGRPRGAKNEATILHELMNRSIEIREAGRARKISVLAAILLKFAEDALKGNAKSAAFLLNRYRGFEGTDETPDISQDDQQILNAFAESLEARLKVKMRKR